MSMVSEFLKVLFVEIGVELRGAYRRAMRGKVPHAEQSQPLSHKDVEHIEAQKRSAARPFPKK